jgi:hypothetical protein
MTSDDYRLIPANFILSTGSTLIGLVTAPLDPVITGIMLPIIFFTIGKGVDVAVRIYLAKRKDGGNV